MPEPVWFRSLYWRIALGFVAMLAVAAGRAGDVFLWLTGRIVGRPAATPQQLADLVARELSRRAHRQPGARPRTRTCARVRPHLPGRSSSSCATAAARRTGRGAAAGLRRPAPRLGRADGPRPRRFRRRRAAALEPARRASVRPPPDSCGAGGGRGGPGGRRSISPIVVNGAQVGPWRSRRARRRSGRAARARPDADLVGLGLLGVGACWCALVDLPSGAQAAAVARARRTRARRRPRPTCARAEGGGDEVGALAHTFNRMADDLGARAAALAASDRARRSCSPTCRTS